MGAGGGTGSLLIIRALSMRIGLFKSNCEQQLSAVTMWWMENWHYPLQCEKHIWR